MKHFLPLVESPKKKNNFKIKSKHVFFMFFISGLFFIPLYLILLLYLDDLTIFTKHSFYVPSFYSEHQKFYNNGFERFLELNSIHFLVYYVGAGFPLLYFFLRKKVFSTWLIKFLLIPFSLVITFFNFSFYETPSVSTSMNTSYIVEIDPTEDWKPVEENLETNYIDISTSTVNDPVNVYFYHITYNKIFDVYIIMITYFGIILLSIFKSFCLFVINIVKKKSLFNKPFNRSLFYKYIGLFLFVFILYFVAPFFSLYFII